MNAEVFVDTNVLLYTIDEDPASASKRQRAQQLLLSERWGWSVQVAAEFFVNATSAKRPFRLADAAALVEAWFAFPTFDAARFLLACILGQPTAAVDPDTLDAQEWQVFRQLPVPAAEVQNIMAGVPLDFACKLVRTLAPFLGEMAAAKARQVFSGESQLKKKPGRRRKRRRRRRGDEVQEPETAGRVNGAALSRECTASLLQN